MCIHFSCAWGCKRVVLDLSREAVLVCIVYVYTRVSFWQVLYMCVHMWETGGGGAWQSHWSHIWDWLTSKRRVVPWGLPIAEVRLSETMEWEARPLMVHWSLQQNGHNTGSWQMEWGLCWPKNHTVNNVYEVMHIPCWWELAAWINRCPGIAGLSGLIMSAFFMYVVKSSEPFISIIHYSMWGLCTFQVLFLMTFSNSSCS